MNPKLKIILKKMKILAKNKIKTKFNKYATYYV